MPNREKIANLYAYLRDAGNARNTPIRSIDEQNTRIFLKDDIPDDTDGISLSYRDTMDVVVEGDSVLLRVRKTPPRKCPTPLQAIAAWLTPGWDDPEQPTVSPAQRAAEKFEDSPERVRAFEKWCTLRDEWLRKQRLSEETARFFERIRALHLLLEENPDTLECMIGTGLLDAPGRGTRHPILLKRVRTFYDPETETVGIRDTNAESELYDALLQELAPAAPEKLQQAQAALSENFYHPLDRNETPLFLKSVAEAVDPAGRFLSDDEPTPEGAPFTVRLSPVYFVRMRIRRTAKAADGILAHIERTGFVPDHLARLANGEKAAPPEEPRDMTIEEHLAAASGEDRDILLPGSANAEQLAIARLAAQNGSVVVQAPAGNGKTQTIANLMGHFLSQGLSVAVASPTKRALADLKAHLPAEFRNLCVSLLEDDYEDMLRTVEGISLYLSRYSSNELKRKMDAKTEERTGIMDELAAVRKDIVAQKRREGQPLVYDGRIYTPEQASSFVRENAERLSYIPGSIQQGRPLPLQTDEFEHLYRTNDSVPSETGLPGAFDLKSLPTPTEHAARMQETKSCRSALDQWGTWLKGKIVIDAQRNMIRVQGTGSEYILVQNPSQETVDQLAEALKTFAGITDQMMRVAADGKRGAGYRGAWEAMMQAIEDTVAYAESVSGMLRGREIEIAPSMSHNELREHLPALAELLQKNNPVLLKATLLWNKQLKAVSAAVTIGGAPISSIADCQLLLRYLELLERRRRAATLWNDLIAASGGPNFSALGIEPEQVCMEDLPEIKRYLDWYDREYGAFVLLFQRSGFEPRMFFPAVATDTLQEDTRKILHAIRNVIPNILKIVKCALFMKSAEEYRQKMLSVLLTPPQSGSQMCIALVKAVQEENADLYATLYRQLAESHEHNPEKQERERLLTILAASAPQWADAIRGRTGIHGLSTCPPDIAEAWKWKQLSTAVDNAAKKSGGELRARAGTLSQKLRRATEDLAAIQAWYHLLYRIEKNRNMRPALQEWKTTVQKLPKSSGKTAPTLKRFIRAKTTECWHIIPAWIMTTDTAAERYDPALRTFDVLIVGEANRSDIADLTMLYAARRVIVVGDDKQPGPNAKQQRVDTPAPDWLACEADASLYDVATGVLPSVMLREHYRALPAIAGYASETFYDEKIVPLRDFGALPPLAAVVPYRIDTVADPAAETVASFLRACLEQPEYDGMTFAVVSMQDDGQAEAVCEIALRRDTASAARVFCGTAARLGNKARDIVFLLLPAGASPEAARNETPRWYNAAVGTARNQLWVFHTLDTDALQPDDARAGLLKYADALDAYGAPKNRTEPTPTATALSDALTASNYDVRQQWGVGTYSIEIVVRHEDKRAAIECIDTQNVRTDEQIRADLEQQAILERLGWHFIRISTRDYAADPQAVADNVKTQLRALGIRQRKTDERTTTPLSASELLSGVKIRAAQLLDEWRAEKAAPKETPPVAKPEAKAEIVPTIPIPAPAETQSISAPMDMPTAGSAADVKTAAPAPGFDLPAAIAPNPELLAHFADSGAVVTPTPASTPTPVPAPTNTPRPIPTETPSTPAPMDDLLTTGNTTDIKTAAPELGFDLPAAVAPNPELLAHFADSGAVVKPTPASTPQPIQAEIPSTPAPMGDLLTTDSTADAKAAALEPGFDLPDAVAPNPELLAHFADSGAEVAPSPELLAKVADAGLLLIPASGPIDDLRTTGSTADITATASEPGFDLPDAVAPNPELLTHFADSGAEVAPSPELLAQVADAGLLVIPTSGPIDDLLTTGSTADITTTASEPGFDLPDAVAPNPELLAHFADSGAEVKPTPASPPIQAETPSTLASMDNLPTTGSTADITTTAPEPDLDLPAAVAPNPELLAHFADSGAEVAPSPELLAQVADAGLLVIPTSGPIDDLLTTGSTADITTAASVPDFDLSPAATPDEPTPEETPAVPTDPASVSYGPSAPGSPTAMLRHAHPASCAISRDAGATDKTLQICAAFAPASPSACLRQAHFAPSSQEGGGQETVAPHPKNTESAALPPFLDESEQNDADSPFAAI